MRSILFEKYFIEESCDVVLMIIEKANSNDLDEILDLQKLSYITEAELYNDNSIEPLNQTIDEIIEEFQKGVILKAFDYEYGIIGSIRAVKSNNNILIRKLIVHPDFQNMGIGKKLLSAIENYYISLYSNIEFYLFTGYKSSKNLYLYRKCGYKEFKTEKISETFGFVHFKKKSNDIYI
ncbi:MAG: GNAT family N-acetyltransferase [Methanobrevibacter arboriphilus]|nr:GNAT family N-acetyltransferase [Methanobrevibacter arboriphilus]